MNLKNTTETLINISKRSFSWIREVFRLPYARLYIAAALILTAVMTVFTFPYEVIILNHIRSIEPSISRGINIGEMDFNLFGRSRVDRIKAVLLNSSELQLNSVSFTLNYNPWRLLKRRIITGSFAVQNMSYEIKNTRINCVGRSEFDVRVSPATGIPDSGTFSATASNVRAEGLSAGGFNIAPVRISELRLDGAIEKGVINLTTFRFSGPDLEGSVTGTVALNNRFNNSRLDVTVFIDSQSRALTDYKALLGILERDPSGRILIRVEGTLGRPKIKLPGKQKAPFSAQ